MDAALLTTVEQLSDDAAGHSGAAAWPAGSTVASPQSGQPVLSRALSDDARNGQAVEMEHKDRFVSQPSVEILLAPSWCPDSTAVVTACQLLSAIGILSRLSLLQLPGQRSRKQSSWTGHHLSPLNT